MRKRLIAFTMALLMVFSMSATVQAKTNKNEKVKEVTKVLAQAPYGGSRVVAYDQGIRYDGKPVIAERSNPNAVLTYETGKMESNFYSLGFSMAKDGWIIIEFDYPIQNGDGNDLRIVEDTWGLPYPRESAAIYVSSDKKHWKYLGEADNQRPVSNIHTITDFDLQKVGMKEARYVMVKDTSVRSGFDKYSPSQDKTLDGFDLNAVLALHDYTVKQSCGGKDNNGHGGGCSGNAKNIRWVWDCCGWYNFFFRACIRIFMW